LRLKRNLYLIVAGIVLCSLLIGGLAEWQDSGAEEGWRFAGDKRIWGPFVPASYIVSAVGVIWLSWYLLKVSGTITSIAKQLKDGLITEAAEEKLNHRLMAEDSAAKKLTIKHLNEAIQEWLDKNSNHIAQLEKQIKELQIQIRLSQRREKNTEAIIYSIRDAVIVIDESDRVLMANEAAGKLFNFDFAGFQHRPVGEIVGSDKSGFVELLSHSRKSKARATRKEIEFVEGQTPKTFDCIISCVYDQNQQACGAIAVLHDITREKQVSQMKNDFVSHVSHELKTPLASITAYSEMLADGEAQDEQTIKEFCSVIQSQAQRLNRLIEDILNISRIESGLIKVEKKPLSLTILIEEQLQMIKSYAEEKNIEIVAQKPIVFDQVYADKDMISQVIVNLLSNAVKYTPAGGLVKIETEVDDTTNLARVSITDTGVGIPEGEIEHVFDKFYRVSANKKQAKGTGLGLNLVKQIVEKVHDGRVFVKSEVGVGSTFGFELPLATPQAVHT